ncbi:MAG: hypothetical protein IKJ62_02490 [Alphaproteobacteria bacterium]|nr:hypothetical protein [Alphaproteobacteria bacterium]
MKKVLMIFGILLLIGVGMRVFLRPVAVIPDTCSCDAGHDHSGADYITEIYTEIQNQYCFAMWLPHGGMWQDMCFDTVDECNHVLSDVPNRKNTDTCYRPEIVPGWCVDDILTGQTRFYDSPRDVEYQIMRTVCTRTESACHAIQKYQAPSSQSQCRKQMVFAHQSEFSHITSESEIIEIIKNNKH